MLTKDIYARANEEFRCEHTGVALRRRTVQVAGKPVVHIWRQCMDCGHGLGAVKKHALSSIAEAELEPYDEALAGLHQQRWRARLQELREQQQEDESEEWWARYEAYLQTPAWQERRQRVLARDGRTCGGCLGQSGLPATQVHHLTYEHLGAEFAWELVAVCLVCHERLHGRSLAGSGAGPMTSDRVPDVQTVQHVGAALRREVNEVSAESLDEVPF